ncbi:hypothetical protein GOP47_0000896 [Adiantum capillus-veneris]|uniref:C2 domain-containing protein n=1 Tax=Adiantum capillus-veneris TaxID=13818 RepID=A0A9D4ZTC8_ADICA|nr:hypothetical protein GOP47_0000896 [Adiantum capillus-veneris]
MGRADLCVGELVDRAGAAHKVKVISRRRGDLAFPLLLAMVKTPFPETGRALHSFSRFSLEAACFQLKILNGMHARFIRVFDFQMQSRLKLDRQSVVMVTLQGSEPKISQVVKALPRNADLNFLYSERQTRHIFAFRTSIMCFYDLRKLWLRALQGLPSWQILGFNPSIVGLDNLHPPPPVIRSFYVGSEILIFFMGLFFGLFSGFVVGLVLVASWSSNMAFRATNRFWKAACLLVLSQISQDEIKKLCSNSYPQWLSFPTFERVKWLNKILEKIWPSIALATSDLIKAIVEPMLAVYCPGGFKMNFSKLFLGNVAPQIEGIRLQTNQLGQLIMDLDFKWGGDPSIILAVQTPVGANLPIQLKNLRLFATVRVIFKLAEDIPCISGVVVALLAKPKPQIRYTLKLIGGSLSGAPGISDVIEDIVESVVSDTLQWPHRIVIPIAQPPVDLSDLELKLQGSLQVSSIKAFSLKNMDMVGQSDPYIIAYVRILFKLKTKVIENNLNPEWNETLNFNVEDQETQALVLKVMDQNVGSDKLLGVVVYPLLKLEAEKTLELRLPLMPSLDMENVQDKHDRGSILIKVLYHAFSKEEQAAAMDAERAFMEAKKKKAEMGMIDGTMDALGDVVGGAGRLVSGGVGINLCQRNGFKLEMLMQLPVAPAILAEENT